MPRFSKRWLRALAGPALAAAVLWGGVAGANDRVGGGADSLARPVQASWVRLPVRAWADRAAALAGRPVIVDRRIDPDRLVTYTGRGEPLRVVLAAVAAALDASVEELASTIRIVPTTSAGLAVWADREARNEAERLPAPARAALRRKRPWSWPAGAPPRELVKTAAAEAAVLVEGLDEIPHDHLPAAALPPLSLVERLDLVLAHFDRRVVWQVEGGSLVGRIRPIEQRAAAAALAADDQPLAVSTRRNRRPPAAVGREVFSLRLEAPLDQAVAAIAARLGLEPMIDVDSLAARGIAADEIVRAHVADASREELLEAVFGPLDLRWTAEAGQLRVAAAAGWTAADMAAAVAARRDLPSVHGEREAVRTALIAAEVPPARVSELFAAADRAILPGTVPSLDGFLFFTRDPAWRPLRRQFAEFLELPQVTAVTPDLIPPLVGYGGVVTFPGITRLTVETATALAGFGADDWAAAIELPGVRTLEPEAAAAIARCPALLVFPHLERLSVAAATNLAAHEGVGIVVGGLELLPDDVAAALAETRSLQGLLLPDLTRLESEPLARRLARQDHAFLPRVTAISPAIAAALRGNDGGELALPAVETLPPEVARQLVGGGYFWLAFGCGSTLSVDSAAILAAHPGQLTFTGADALPVAAAAALAPHTGTLRLPHVERLSGDLAAALARHAGPLVLEGITHLDGPDAAAVARALAAAPGILALPAVHRISAAALEHLLLKPDLQLPEIATIDVTGAGGHHHEDAIAPRR